VFRTDRADGERSADCRRWSSFNVKSEVAPEPSAIGTRPGFRAAALHLPRGRPPGLRLLSRDP
jgi:hypothetical protein